MLRPLPPHQTKKSGCRRPSRTGGEHKPKLNITATNNNNNNNNNKQSPISKDSSPVIRLPEQSGACSISTGSDEENLEPTMQLNSYLTAMVINRGSLGTVYEVTSSSNPGQILAKKTVETAGRGGSQLRPRIEQELRILRRLEGVYASLPETIRRTTVRLVDSTVQPDEISLVMNYIPGGDLERFASYMISPLGMEALRFLSAELVHAVEFLHQQQILHRDIKPENILLDARGHLVLTDFDLAVDMRQVDEPLTARVGTMAYIAPEVAKREEYGYASDIFSLALTLVSLSNRHHFRSAKTPYYQLSPDELEQLSRAGAYSLGRFIQRLPEACNLFTSLLHYRAEKRMTFEAIRSHAFFSAIDFGKLAAGTLKPPRICVPKLQ